MHSSLSLNQHLGSGRLYAASACSEQCQALNLALFAGNLLYPKQIDNITIEIYEIL